MSGPDIIGQLQGLSIPLSEFSAAYPGFWLTQHQALAACTLDSLNGPLIIVQLAAL
jgi:hypothetical protein